MPRISIPNSPAAPTDYNALVSKLREHDQAVDALESGLLAAPFINVKTYGALGNGVADDRAAIQAALDAAVIQGFNVYFPPGTYMLSRAGFGSLQLNSGNVSLFGSKGSTWLKHQAGMPDASTFILRLDNAPNVALDGLGFDGNWGAVVGVTDVRTGINHTTQSDPKNYGIFARNQSNNLTIKNCAFRQTYGDAIWVGACTNVNIEYTTVDVSGRNGITLSGSARNVAIRDTRLTNIWAGTIDTEPVNTFGGTRDVLIDHCYLGRWWSDTTIRFPLTIVGSDNAASDASAARGYRVTGCTIEGPVLISNAYDCVIENCRINCDYTTQSSAPIVIDHCSEDVVIRDSYIFDRSAVTIDYHQAAVVVRHYITSFRPSRVKLQNLSIKARNGRHGIAIDGAGGVGTDSGTASSVTSTTLVDNTKNWTTNQFSGAIVTIGGVTGVVNNNTNTTLTVFEWMDTPSALQAAATPNPGAYKIIGRNSDILIDGCTIDCGADEDPAGGFGVYVDAGDIGAKPANARIRIKDNTIFNATGDAINVQSRNIANPIRLLSITNNLFADNQPTPTCTVGIRFQNTANITQYIQSGNLLDGVSTLTLP